MPELLVDVRHRLNSIELELKFTTTSAITVVFGPSGSGKTTLLKFIAGLFKPQHGVIRFRNQTWLNSDTRANWAPEDRGVSMVFQSLALFPHLTVRENVAFGAHGSAEIDGWIDRFRVSHAANRKPATLSGGEAQRVALARAFARKPQLLLLDEPFSSLDESLRADLVAEVRAIVLEQGLTTVLVTHDRREAVLLGDTCIRLEAGHIHSMGRTSELLGTTAISTRDERGFDQPI